MAVDNAELREGVFAVLENMALVEGRDIVAQCCAEFLARNCPGYLSEQQLAAMNLEAASA